MEAQKQDPEINGAMIEKGAVPALNLVIENHPLNEKLVVKATRALANFAKYHADSILAEKTVEKVLLGLNRLAGTEDDALLVKALKATLRIAKATGAGEFMKGTDMKDFMDLLKQHRSPDVVAMGTELLKSLCADPEFCMAFMEQGGISQLTTNLTK